MEEMRAYVSKVSKEDGGESVGAWFTFPVDFEDVKEKLGLNSSHDDYYITNYEAPFEIDQFERLDHLNRAYYLLANMKNSVIADNMGKIRNTFRISILEMAQYEEYFKVYKANSFEELAEQFVEKGTLGEIPDNLKNYIDYKSYARDLENEMNTVQLSGYIVEDTR